MLRHSRNSFFFTDCCALADDPALVSCFDSLPSPAAFAPLASAFASALLALASLSAFAASSYAHRSHTVGTAADNQARHAKYLGLKHAN